MIVRHYWVNHGRGVGVVCSSAESKTLAALFDCSGCGATIPAAELNIKNGNLWNHKHVWRTADHIWHERLRPMAALCSLVEEADDSPA